MSTHWLGSHPDDCWTIATGVSGLSPCPIGEFRTGAAAVRHHSRATWRGFLKQVRGRDSDAGALRPGSAAVTSSHLVLVRIFSLVH